MGNMDISVVVPCFNEAEGISAFWEELNISMASIPHSWEAIFINDGSTDNTLEVLSEFKCSLENQCRVLDLSRNFGKEAAITAGLDHAIGKAVVVIDADLQHPPEVIVDMVRRWENGAEVVMGRRKARDTDTAPRRWLSNKFYSASQALFIVELPKDVGDFLLMDRIVVDKVIELRETERFMKGIFAWVGFRQEIVDFDVAPRRHGEASFNFWGLWSLALDGVTSFSTVPLRIWLFVGVAISFLSLIYALFVVLAFLVFGSEVPGYPSLVVLITFIGGINLMGLGILGEYLGRSYMEAKKRPVYVVRRVINK